LIAGASAHLTGGGYERAFEHYERAHAFARTDAEKWDALRGQVIASIYLEHEDATVLLDALEALSDGSPDREISLITVRSHLNKRLGSVRGESRRLAHAAYLATRVRDPLKSSALFYSRAGALVIEGHYERALKVCTEASLFAKT
jgi:hypothetical protein